MTSSAFRDDFTVLMGQHLQEELTPQTDSVQARGVDGKLEDGIRTQMVLGDLDVFGDLSDTPVRGNVEEIRTHYYSSAQLQQTPRALLLPLLVLSGAADTENGGWKMIHEEEKTKVWAFLSAMAMMKQEGETGMEESEAIYKKMKKASKEVEVLLLGVQDMDSLWAEWSNLQNISLTNLQFSPDRCTIQYRFVAKLEASLQKKTPGVKVLKKHVFEAFIEAEQAGKFSTAKGTKGIRRESDIAQIMSFGEWMNKWHLMEAWQELEVVPEGKTPFYSASFAITFPDLVNNSQEQAAYVMGTFKKIYELDPRGKAQLNRKKLLETKGPKMKSYVKTLDLQFQWVKNLINCCELSPIQAPQKTQSDFLLVKQSLDLDLAGGLLEDKSGKKAVLHPNMAELLITCLSVLAGLEHFNVFLAAENMHKTNFEQTCHVDGLKRLQSEMVSDSWKIATIRYTAEMKKAQELQNGGPAEEEEQEAQLPTRSEAIQNAAQAEVETYLPYIILTGDSGMDRQKILAVPLASKELTSEQMTWNPETQGNRRCTMYDETGRKNPKWSYVGGRNEWRCKIGFAKEDFEEAVDIWGTMASLGEGDHKMKVDVFSVWNVDQMPASRAIKRKAETLTNVSVKKTNLKGLQQHVERRLFTTAPAGPDHHLEGLPGVSEECYDFFSGPVPPRKKHLKSYGPCLDNLHPDEFIPLRNITKSEPQVTLLVKKQIFPPDFDEPAGDNSLREEQVGTCITQWVGGMGGWGAGWLYLSLNSQFTIHSVSSIPVR